MTLRQALEAPLNNKTSLASPRFLDALDYAVRLHGNDVRKGSAVPYVAHLLSVCSLVLTDGGSEDEAIAALLHDALEDHPQETSPEVISDRFGRNVLDIVQACTDTPPDYKGGAKPPWRQRKISYIEHVRTAGASARRVALADKLDNARSSLVDYRRFGESLWARFNAGKEEQLWLYRSLVQAFREAGASRAMIEELDAIVAELERTS